MHQIEIGMVVRDALMRIIGPVKQVEEDRFFVSRDRKMLVVRKDLVDRVIVESKRVHLLIPLERLMERDENRTG